jgi:hypothetical protein
VSSEAHTFVQSSTVERLATGTVTGYLSQVVRA